MKLFAIIRHCFCLMLLCSLLVGCGDSRWKVESAYGKVRGVQGGGVNGLGVFAGMLENDGYRVSTWDKLSPKLERADVIVWAPDDYTPPFEEAREWYEEWLAAKPRTLIYIGRDYDAEPDYWRQVSPTVDPIERIQTLRSLAAAETRVQTDRLETPEKEFAGWFTFKRRAPQPEPSVYSSPDSYWNDLLTTGPPEARLASEIAIPVEADAAAGEWFDVYNFEPLVIADGEPFAYRIESHRFPESQILVVVNGSTLLNFGLTKPGNVSFAEELMVEVANVSAMAHTNNAYFVESGRAGLSVREADASSSFTGLEPLTVYPVNLILLHLLVLGIVLCLALFPYFGRPYDPPRKDKGDFGRYLTGIGELLARTRNTTYAVDKLNEWKKASKRD